MNVDELVNLALANTDDGRVDVMALEPAEFSAGVVSALGEIVAELAGNALTHGNGNAPIRIAGLWEGDGYLMTISDRGRGMSDEDLNRLNGLLAEFSRVGRYSGATLGLPIIARLAARHGLRVQLVPGAPGISARIRIPPDQVSPRAPVTHDNAVADVEEPADTIDDVFNPYRYPGGRLELAEAPGSGPDYAEQEIIVQGETSTALYTHEDMESFLDSIFAPLIGSGHRTTETWDLDIPDDEPGLATITKLRVRVPGDNYDVSADSPSIASAERAIDIKNALATFDAGRRSASERRDQYRV
jgi:hypothetical protein